MTMLRLFKKRDFALLWIGSTVSLLGDGVYFVAIAWQVYQLENRPSALALVGVAWTLPQLACVTFAGVVTDRFDRRRVMIVANAMSGFAIGTMAILAISGALRLWQVWILVAIYGVGVALFLPAASAIVPELVSPDLLVEANALRQVVRPLTMRLVGPALGGVLVALLGAGEALLVDALSFFVAVGTLLLIRSRAGIRPAFQAGSFGREAAEGLRFVRSQDWLWLSLLTAAAWLLIYVGPLEVLLPFLVKNRVGGGSGGLGLVFAAGGLGAMLCSWLVAARGLPRRPLVFMYVVWSLATFALAALALATTLWQAMLCSFFVFGLLSTGDIAWQTTLQRRVPNELLGRVASIDWLVSAGLVPVSFVVVGPVAGTVGSSATMLGAGLLGGVLLASIIALPPIREPESREYPAPAHA
jgi:DHA3 family tetracycline resistance protein-like MFS transporter